VDAAVLYAPDNRVAARFNRHDNDVFVPNSPVWVNGGIRPRYSPDDPAQDRAFSHPLSSAELTEAERDRFANLLQAPASYF